MRPQILHLLVILTTFCIGQQVKAQYFEKDFVLYSVKNGLSDNIINCVLQDDHGYMWVGTKAGLNRFDGTAFRKFYQGSLPLNLPSDIITGFKNFGHHKLGIFSRGGLQVLNTDSYKVSRYIIPDTTAFTTPLNAIWDAVQLPDESFALTTSAGFYVLNEKTVQYRHDAFNIKDIGRKQMLFGRQIFGVGNDNYIVYTNETEQHLYNSRKRAFTQIDKEEMPWKPFMNPRNFPGDCWLLKLQLSQNEFVFLPRKTDSIVYYNSASNRRVASALPAAITRQLDWTSKLQPVGDSMLFLNSAFNGFYRLFLNRQTGEIITDEKKYLSSYQIQCLFEDKEGRLWAGTTVGLLKQELVPPMITGFQYQSNLPAVPGDFFTCVYRYKNLLYAGQYTPHHGLTILDASTMKRTKDILFYDGNAGWNEIISMEMYHRDTLWIGTWAGLLWFDTKTEHYGKVLDEKTYPWAANFHAILAPPRSDGYAWFCAVLSGKVVRYHIPSHSYTVFTPESVPALPFEKVKSIVYDSYGDVWIGGHALTRWNNRLQAFDTVIKVYSGANKFNDDIVALSADDNGSLWLHNADNGLLQYNIREKRFASYTMQDGLPSSVLQSLSKATGDRLWIAGNNQLCLMDMRTKQFTVYGYADGMPERVPTCRRIYFDSISNQMYLCAENYIIRFPSVPEKRDDNTGEIIIEELAINNDSIRFQPGDKIELTHNDNNLGFQFTVVDYEKSNYQFAYRLNNSAAWNTINSQHTISFNNLTPGKYMLELSASGKPGIRKTKSILIIIQPPFWARGWFIVLSVISALALFAWLLHLRLKRIRQKANIDKQLSQTEMKALQSQMNPHFIFNSLNSIREMILTEENKLASHYLSKFAHLIRITLEQSTQEMVSLRSTIDYLERYIEMESIRNGFLKYEINVSEDLNIDETLISPMIIQPFVENSIWHGISASRKDITIRISFEKNTNSLLCTVDDDGVGISHSQSLKRINGTHRRSHGIANVKNRIELFNEKYNLKCGIIIIDKKEIPKLNESGTLVTIQLPYQTIES